VQTNINFLVSGFLVDVTREINFYLFLQKKSFVSLRNSWSCDLDKLYQYSNIVIVIFLKNLSNSHTHNTFFIAFKSFEIITHLLLKNTKRTIIKAQN